MFAVYAESFSADDPLTGLVVGERPDPDAARRVDDGHRQGRRASTTTTSGRCGASG